MKIVFVEDDEILRKSLAFFLKAKGYDVVEFDNGLDAMTYIGEKGAEIDLLITDLNLPFAGGQQIIHLTKTKGNNNTKIIVLTSSGVESTELEVFELGADDFVSKPFSPAVLLQRIKKLVG